MAEDFEARSLALSHGVTRYQLYEGLGVPKTSHNSAAAVAFAPIATPRALFEAPINFVRAETIARRAQETLVSRAEASQVAAQAGIDLIELAGSGEGVIGALSAVALRAGCNDGCFVDLPGIREVVGRVSVADLIRHTGVALVIDAEVGKPLGGDVMLDAGYWARPRLPGGRPVLVACYQRGGWVSADLRPK